MKATNSQATQGKKIKNLDILKCVAEKKGYA